MQIMDEYQAEESLLSGAVAATDQDDKQDQSFVDFLNLTDDFGKSTINRPSAETYGLEFRSAQVSDNPQPTVNDGNLRTGIWDNWQASESSETNLNSFWWVPRDRWNPYPKPYPKEWDPYPKPYPNPYPKPHPDELIRINFQPDGASTPLGYTADTGLAYSDARGFGWITEESVGEVAPTPIDISQLARDRNRAGYEQRLDTLLHLDHINSDTTAAAWEYALPNGRYSVAASVGDNSHSNSQHLLRVEGKTLLPSFSPNATHEFELATTTVNVMDGKLTLDSIGGTNTKVNYLEILPVANFASTVTESAPLSRATHVSPTGAVTLDVSTLGIWNTVDGKSLNTKTVQLSRTRDGASISGTVSTTGDQIVFQPSASLAPDTHYTLRTTQGVEDVYGNDFLPFSTTFTTGSDDPTAINFERSTVSSGDRISTLEISPDHAFLYGATLAGDIHRWQINGDGTLSDKQTFSGLADRAVIGFVFDPTDPNTVWVSHNDDLSSSTAFTGKVSKLTLEDGDGFEASIQDYVQGLPRSVLNHFSNSLEFGPDGALYLSQGSNSDLGAPDETWGLRPEQLLTAAILRIDPTLEPPSGGFNVQTEDANGITGDYDPNSPGAPVTVYGQGVRNAYDLVWHSNGSLYVPTNGGGADGINNTPDDPSQPGDQSLTGVSPQSDYLFKVQKGGYYGHPNPLQGNYILNGGNPTEGTDLAEVSEYPVGTPPDPNYQGFAYDFGPNQSPNGAIEYQSQAFGGALDDHLLVVEFNVGDDIVALQPDSNGDIIDAFPIASGFNNPLDLVENPLTGDIYVAEVADENNLSDDFITLLSPA